MTEPVRIAFACNDDSGDQSGDAEMVDVAGLLELEPRTTAGLPFRARGGDVWVGYRRVSAVASQEWHGSMAWNAYWFAPEVAADVVMYLHASGLLSCVGSTEPLLNFWDAPSREALLEAFAGVAA